MNGSRAKKIRKDVYGKDAYTGPKDRTYTKKLLSKSKVQKDEEGNKKIVSVPTGSVIIATGKRSEYQNTKRDWKKSLRC